ncbi:MAG: DUF2723 domain-containing protein [Candidatus Rokuibacteriota bacterium]|nr:MAG: DUF2723 domain-containing protein [Candidatus Rokubacteria bacterium]
MAPDTPRRLGASRGTRDAPRPPARVVDLPSAAWTGPAILAALGAGLVPLGMYLATLSPTVNGGDSGEFVTVAYLLGVAHPPGYPLHTLLAKPLTLLPVGSVAWRVNLLSALCDAGAAALLFRAVVLLSGDLAAGLLAAGAFAFAPLIWPYAITAEVFALNNLFAAGLLYWSARALREATADEGTPSRTLGLGMLWASLGLSNHHTLVFFAIPFGLLVLALAGRRLREPRLALPLLGCVVLGFLPYVYLPIAGARLPAVTWGEPSTWSGFLTHFFRREYGTFRLADESVGTAGSLPARLLRRSVERRPRVLPRRLLQPGQHASRRSAARLHAGAVLAAGVRRAGGAPRPRPRRGGRRDGTRGTLGPLAGCGRAAARARRRPPAGDARARQHAGPRLRRGGARLGAAQRRPDRLRRRPDRQRALPAAGGGRAPRRRRPAARDRTAAVVPPGGRAEPAGRRRPASAVHVPALPRPEPAAPVRRRLQPWTVAADARRGLCPVAARARRGGLAARRGAAVRQLGTTERGLVRPLRSRPGRAVSAVELGARSRHHLLEAVRAVRSGRRAAGGAPARRAGHAGDRRARAGDARRASDGGPGGAAQPRRRLPAPLAQPARGAGADGARLAALPRAEPRKRRRPAEDPPAGGRGRALAQEERRRRRIRHGSMSPS